MLEPLGFLNQKKTHGALSVYGPSGTTERSEGCEREGQGTMPDEVLPVAVLALGFFTKSKPRGFLLFWGSTVGVSG
jgi:hypothetical protein